MADKTNIGWTDSTWNYIAAYHRETGQRGWFCTKRTRACANCYAEELNLRLGNGLEYLPKNLDKIRFEVERKLLEAPLRAIKNSKLKIQNEERRCRIFVNSMTDFFHPAIPDWMRRIGFAVMMSCLDSTFQILTKQPERALQFFQENTLAECFMEAHHRQADYPLVWEKIPAWLDLKIRGEWPLPNVALVVSVGDQADADCFIPLLLQMPAAVRGLSLEPLLDRIDMGCAIGHADDHAKNTQLPNTQIPNSPIGWVILGGESGAQRRDPGVEPLIDAAEQCVAAGVPVFVKQDCALRPGQQGRIPDAIWALKQFPKMPDEQKNL